MRRRRWSSCLVSLLATGCTVGNNDPFMPMASGSATASATASGTSSANASAGGSDATGSGGGGEDPSSADTSGPEGTSTGGWDPGGEDSTTEGETTAASDSTGTPTTSGTTSSGSTSGDAEVCMGSALDPQLATPPNCEPTCTAIGFGVDCPGVEYCRLKDSQTAVCEGCEACGNLHAPCVDSIDCDIIFTCFMGQCTAQCDLSTPQTCGNPAACTDVGHPTHGVCDPNL